MKPLSQRWGVDRGVPIHRTYIWGFLEKNSKVIAGECLEFHDGYYTRAHGGNRVSHLDILHLSAGNPQANLVGDICGQNEIPSDKYDCIICSHVLQSVKDLRKGIFTLYRILKPGGVLLLAVPLLSMSGSEYKELWMITPTGLEELLSEHFSKERFEITAYGNSLVAALELRGFVEHELTQHEINSHDKRFAVEVCARAIK